MDASVLRCAACNAPQDWLAFSRPGPVPCVNCGAEITVHLFPALFKEHTKGRAGETALIDGESTCFYHPAKRAEVSCNHCGRFLCGLCDVEIKGEHLCPGCIEEGAGEGGRLAELRADYTQYDSIALTLAAFSPFIFYLIPITAPIVLYMVFRYWRTPMSAAPRSRWRFVVAAILAAVELGLVIAFVVFALPGMITALGEIE